MIIEITGTSTRNKGAELMLAAITKELGSCPKIELAVDSNFGTYQDRARYGLWQKIRIERIGRSKIGFSLLPHSFRQSSGMTTEAKIGGIIDASGFAFGDQLPVATAERFARNCARWKSQGKRIVLLPQALGPFQTKPARRAFLNIVRHADLIHARDQDSISFAIDAAPDHTGKFKLAPDITIGVSGVPVLNVNFPKPTMLLVPNIRMMDRTKKFQANSYIPFLNRCINASRKAGLNPIILIHDDGEDENLLNAIQNMQKQNLPVIHETDPLRLKGIISLATLVIGSRFHALLGALSSGVPVVAAGWSHKYKRLLEDFNCEHLTLNVDAPESEISHCIMTAVGPNRDLILRSLSSAKIRAIKKIDQMWIQVKKVFNLL
jgi:polysaccharide pyruvyl transferase WcaK-like protein